jgi:hypothetical protein
MAPWLLGHLLGDFIFQNDWMAKNKKQHTRPCLVHVCIYTLLVCVLSGWWQWWQFLAVAVPHYAIDRTHFIRNWMHFMGQRDFCQAPMAPWSMIVVDNIFHLVCLYLVACIS